MIPECAIRTARANSPRAEPDGGSAQGARAIIVERQTQGPLYSSAVGVAVQLYVLKGENGRAREGDLGGAGELER